MSLIQHPASGFSIADPYSIPLQSSPTPQAARTFFDKLILSASGWRGVFGRDDEDQSEDITPSAAYAVARMALVFARFLKAHSSNPQPVLALGIDTRPSGPAIADVMTRIYLAEGIDVRYTFIASAPEIMAWTGWTNRKDPGAEPSSEKTSGIQPVIDGFCYISASHNPVGHNGVKFGLKDGGVLAPVHANELAAALRERACTAEDIALLRTLAASPDARLCGRVYAECSYNKRLAVSAYTLFCRQILAAVPTDGHTEGSGAEAMMQAEERSLDRLEQAIRERGIGLIIDMNGSARSLSIDVEFFSGLGVDVQTINNRPRSFAHRIVPEGESLEQCRWALEAAHRADSRYVFGYVPDCDGDRGNIVIWDESIDGARTLEAQETFALAVLAELASMEYDRIIDGRTSSKLAVVGNDATSLRADQIARCFGAAMFRAETGEANVVALARALRSDGYQVRILGEGSNGGVITYPASVRDPLNTIGALLKLIALQSSDEAPCPYQLWMERSAQAQNFSSEFSLADIAGSLPAFSSTSVFETRAALRVQSRDMQKIKNNSRRLFDQAWPRIQELLLPEFGNCSYETIVSRGVNEIKLDQADDCGSGGLKFLVKDSTGTALAFFWMRASGTEPVFRIMVDAGSKKENLEPRLLELLTDIVRNADEG
ncbi:MAG: phosphatidylglycerol lysyltransferase [Spirochaetes bacterium]|nr:phosphatidylglycerol lysyltransferase [Spirochaetota bacterium]MBU0956053.1 phosphatidylglycerol lysyltransferase [Spirochaetota bacterium]